MPSSVSTAIIGTPIAGYPTPRTAPTWARRSRCRLHRRGRPVLQEREQDEHRVGGVCVFRWQGGDEARDVGIWRPTEEGHAHPLQVGVEDGGLVADPGRHRVHPVDTHPGRLGEVQRAHGVGEQRLRARGRSSGRSPR